MSITILGDICPARLVEISDKGVVCKDLLSTLSKSYVVANLEAPIADKLNEELDHLVFQGKAEFLDQLKFVDMFCLSNNHINDLGDNGIEHTFDSLNTRGFSHNGIFTSQYSPGTFGNVSFIFASDMMNVPFESDSAFKYLYMFSEQVDSIVADEANKGRFVVLYLHTGLLFCRLPSPKIRERIYQLIDSGAGLVVTTHSHCFGAVEEYGQSVICYNLGDFLMDGQSMRRRRSMALEFFPPNVDREPLTYNIRFLENRDFHVSEASGITKLRCQLSFWSCRVLLKLPLSVYSALFNFIYRISIISHVTSTLAFILRSRGIKGTLAVLSRRKDEVLRYFSWIGRDRRESSTDYDAIESDRKKVTTRELR